MKKRNTWTGIIRDNFVKVLKSLREDDGGVIYSNFEKGIVNYMKDEYPELTENRVKIMLGAIRNKHRIGEKLVTDVYMEREGNY